MIKGKAKPNQTTLKALKEALSIRDRPGLADVDELLAVLENQGKRFPRNSSTIPMPPVKPPKPE